MMRVEKYTETVNYIKDSYNFMNKAPAQEFLEVEEITVQLVISGLTREKAKDIRAMLGKLGISSPRKE
jgi:hypothetical protein